MTLPMIAAISVSHVLPGPLLIASTSRTTNSAALMTTAATSSEAQVAGADRAVDEQEGEQRDGTVAPSGPCQAPREPDVRAAMRGGFRMLFEMVERESGAEPPVLVQLIDLHRGDHVAEHPPGPRC